METHIELSAEQVTVLLGPKAKPLAKKMHALIKKQKVLKPVDPSKGYEGWDYDPTIPFKFMHGELHIPTGTLRVVGGVEFTHSGHTAVITANIKLGLGKTSLKFDIWG